MRPPSTLHRLPPERLLDFRQCRGASARSSSSVRSCTGCATKHAAASGLAEQPRLLARAASTNASEATSTAGRPERLELQHVAQTARHAGASVGERLDHRVAALGDLARAGPAARAW